MSLSNRVRTILAAGRPLLMAAIAASLIPLPALAQGSRPEAGTVEQLAPVPQPNSKRERLPKGNAARLPRKAPDRDAMRRQQQELIESVAAKLGVGLERLIAAIRDARIDQVNKAVAEGQLSREQADRMIEQMTRGQDPARPASPDPLKPASPEAASHITVSFKLDPRLTKGLYMGERWVSPPTYMGAQPGNEFTVEARAHARRNGKPMDIGPRWIPSDPEMVAVSPTEGKEVKITVKRAGQSTLEVASQEVSRKLSIKAWNQSGGIQAEISQ